VEKFIVVFGNCPLKTAKIKKSDMKHNKNNKNEEKDKEKNKKN
jgi:hypothetical protein